MATKAVNSAVSAVHFEATKEADWKLAAELMRPILEVLGVPRHMVEPWLHVLRELHSGAFDKGASTGIDAARGALT